MNKEFVETDQLEAMAGSVSVVIKSVPELLFFDQELLNKILKPLENDAHQLLGGWIHKVVPAYYLGCNAMGDNDTVNATIDDIFYGVYKGISLVDSSIEPWEPQKSTVVPSLIFETLDNIEFQYGLAQTYLHVKVPLVDNIIAIEKIGVDL